MLGKPNDEDDKASFTRLHTLVIDTLMGHRWCILDHHTLCIHPCGAHKPATAASFDGSSVCHSPATKRAGTRID